MSTNINELLAHVRKELFLEIEKEDNASLEVIKRLVKGSGGSSMSCFSDLFFNFFGCILYFKLGFKWT